jgi:hypothetical protein
MKLFDMDKKLLFMVATLPIWTLITTNPVMAQNTTTNTSYAAGSLMDSVNQSTSELGQNASSFLNNTGGKVVTALGQLKENVSSVGSELGQNASDVGTNILNKTEEALKKAGTGAADVLSNISGEIKEGINEK